MRRNDMLTRFHMLQNEVGQFTNMQAINYNRRTFARKFRNPPL